MKKLNLKKSNDVNGEILCRSQLKKVLGGNNSVTTNSWFCWSHSSCTFEITESTGGAPIELMGTCQYEDFSGLCLCHAEYHGFLYKDNVCQS
ncbi:hypothetical protein [Pedobacter frigoris]|uniref:hypothetical protein n=1 Tax=Pedobacter frigoris TaxID=2571272 RepID=UPI00292F6737|nr:hypothetical protein [Pedobacter frigoris]